MEIKIKPKALVTVVIVIAILAGGFFYWNSEARKYKSETKTLRLISEHQEAEIKVIEQKAMLELLTKGPLSTQPMKLPREQELSRKALEDPNE